MRGDGRAPPSQCGRAVCKVSEHVGVEDGAGRAAQHGVRGGGSVRGSPRAQRVSEGGGGGQSQGVVQSLFVGVQVLVLRVVSVQKVQLVVRLVASASGQVRGGEGQGFGGFVLRRDVGAVGVHQRPLQALSGAAVRQFAGSPGPAPERPLRLVVVVFVGQSGRGFGGGSRLLGGGSAGVAGGGRAAVGVGRVS